MIRNKLIILTLLLAMFLSCKTDRVDNQRELRLAQLVYLTNRTNDVSIERNLCNEAVLVMNQCVGAGSGFNALVMCSNINMNKGTTADATAVPPVTAKTAVENYTTLVSCVKGKVAEYNCNFTQYRVATAKSGYDSYFKACDVPSGIINSNNL